MFGLHIPAWGVSQPQCHYWSSVDMPQNFHAFCTIIQVSTGHDRVPAELKYAKRDNQGLSSISRAATNGYFPNRKND